MFGGEAPTPLDLQFRLFGFPIRVSVWFWLITALLGSHFLTLRGPAFFGIWVGVVFVSILIHELGHAFAYRLFGSPAAVLLHGFGGLAFGQPLSSPWKRMAVSLAGPFAQFALAGVVFASAFAGWPARNEYTAFLYVALFYVNIVWAIFNLFPILPLDGGNVCREVLHLCRFRNPDAGAAAVSVAFAGVLALAAVASFLRLDIPVLRNITDWYSPGPFMTLWLILLAVDNYQRYQLATRMRPRYYDDSYDDDTPPWRRR